MCISDVKVCCFRVIVYVCLLLCLIEICLMSPDLCFFFRWCVFFVCLCCVALVFDVLYAFNVVVYLYIYTDAECCSVVFYLIVGVLCFLQMFWCLYVFHVLCCCIYIVWCLMICVRFVDDVPSCVCVVLLSYLMFLYAFNVVVQLYIYTVLNVAHLSFLCLTVCCAVADVLLFVCVSCFVLLHL